MKLKLSLCFLILFMPVTVVSSPKLLVVVVVDQLGAKTLDENKDMFSSGFKTLLSESFFFNKAIIDYIPTDTSPGHASIMTGFPPSKTGIVGNRWWDRVKKKTVYALSDTDHGISPQNLMVETVGDALKKKNVESKIVSLSLKDRAAVFLAGKTPDLVLWLDKKKGIFKSSSYYNKEEQQWLADFNDAKSPFNGVKKVQKVKMENFLTSLASDKFLFELVKVVLENTALGEDDSPDILALSFSGTDYIGHRYGPNSDQMKNQLKSLDQILGELLSLLEEKVGRGNFVLGLTSDHGVLPVPESKEGKKLKAKRVSLFQFKTLLEEKIQTVFPIEDQRWIVAFHPPHLYLNQELVEKLKLSWPAFLNRVRNALAEVPGVAYVFDPRKSNWDDDFSEIYKRGIYSNRSGDLLIRFDFGLLVKKYGVTTGHGSPYVYDREVPMLFWGGMGKKKQLSGSVRLVDFAPTLRHVLELSPSEDLQGQILIE